MWKFVQCNVIHKNETFIQNRSLPVYAYYDTKHLGCDEKKLIYILRLKIYLYV